MKKSWSTPAVSAIAIGNTEAVCAIVYVHSNRAEVPEGDVRWRKYNGIEGWFRYVSECDS